MLLANFHGILGVPTGQIDGQVRDGVRRFRDFSGPSPTPSSSSTTRHNSGININEHLFAIATNTGQESAKIAYHARSDQSNMATFVVRMLAFLLEHLEQHGATAAAELDELRLPIMGRTGPAGFRAVTEAQSLGIESTASDAILLKLRNEALSIWRSMIEKKGKMNEKLRSALIAKVGEAFIEARQQYASLDE
ncbi:hypothetical protein HK102_000464 [Quaeritorhiza haematococci]|nr:hypothetical protein HK102_000464 [Quaeritorhiza haematococci]